VSLNPETTTEDAAASATSGTLVTKMETGIPIAEEELRLVSEAGECAAMMFSSLLRKVLVQALAHLEAVNGLTYVDAHLGKPRALYRQHLEAHGP